MNNPNQKIILFPISIGELKELIAECIRTESQKIVPKPPDDNTLISRKEAAKMLNMSTSTLSKYCKNGDIKYYRIGTIIKLKRQDILKNFEVMNNLKYGRKREY